MGKRVLLVTSSYKPVTIADMHRVRHLAWELPKIGWNVEILVPNIDFQRKEYVEPESGPLFNPMIQVHEVAPNHIRIFSLLSMRTIGWRALLPMAKAGDALLKSKHFDIVYISTANFNLFCLGRWWWEKHRVPYILDYHDPWVQDVINYTTTSNRFKRKMSALLSPWMERYAISRASGIVSVSPTYINQLRRRYPNLSCLTPDRAITIPFSACEVDFLADTCKAESQSQEIEIIYTGAGGTIMVKSFETICAALADVRKREPALLNNLKLRLLGTQAYWKANDPKPLQEIANRFGLEDIVEELPPRIAYLQSIRLLKKSQGVIVLGVDDPAYVPSKFFTYLLSGKPILACFRADSAALGLFREFNEGVTLLTFDGGDDSRDGEPKYEALREYLRKVISGTVNDPRASMKKYLSSQMAERHAALFNYTLDRKIVQ